MKIKRTPLQDMTKIQSMAEDMAWDGLISFTSAHSLAGRNINLDLEDEYQQFLALDIFDYLYSYELPPLTAEDIERNLGTEGRRRILNKVLKEMVKAGLLVYTEEKKYQLPPELDAESRTLVPLINKEKVKAYRVQRISKLDEILNPQK